MMMGALIVFWALTNAIALVATIRAKWEARRDEYAARRRTNDAVILRLARMNRRHYRFRLAYCLFAVTIIVSSFTAFRDDWTQATTFRNSALSLFSVLLAFDSVADVRDRHRNAKEMRSREWKKAKDLFLRQAPASKESP